MKPEFPRTHPAVLEKAFKIFRVDVDVDVDVAVDVGCRIGM